MTSTPTYTSHAQRRTEAATNADLTALAASLPCYIDQNPPEAPVPTLESALCAHCYHLLDQHTADVLAPVACTVRGCGCARATRPSTLARLRARLDDLVRRHIVDDDPRPVAAQRAWLDDLERLGARRLGVAR